MANTTKNEIVSLLKEVKREGIENLIDFLDRTDFYTAPSSTRFHGSYEGGLLEHSLNVYKEERLVDVSWNKEINNKYLSNSHN